MKSVSVSIPMKVGAIVLLTLLLFAAVLSGFGTACLVYEGAYDGFGASFVDSKLSQTLASQLRNRALSLCNWGLGGPSYAALPSPTPTLEQSPAPDQASTSDQASTPDQAPEPDAAQPALSDGTFTIYSAPAPSEAVSATVSFTITADQQQALDYLLDPASTNYRICFSDARTGEQLYGPADASGLIPLQLDGALSHYDAATDRYLGGLRVAEYLDPKLGASDQFSFFKPLYERMYAWRYALPVICLISLLLSALAYAYLLYAAGRRPGEDAVRPSVFDRIPTDVFYVLTLGLAACTALLFGLGFNLTDASDGRFISSLVPLLMLGVISAIFILLLFILLSMSTATRVKMRTFLSSALTVRFVRWVWRGVRSFSRMIGTLLQNLAVLWRLLLGAVGYSVLTVCMAASRTGFFVFLWLAASIAAILLLCRFAVGLDRLQRGAKAIAGGELSWAIDARYLPRDEREMAADLSNISAGIGRAVEERMKSERMKTDLITNVSHDLKTPLTSIVSYIDLLKKEDLHNETADGYVAVLDRQAQRLKKLTEDIVEASKASSGVLNVNLAPTDAAELLRQCAAEYAERFAAAGLTPVLRIPDAPVTASADGRLLWRVFDNLLGNVVKYAMPGTRVYLDAAADDAGVTLSVRNISKEPLERSGDELMERFVRGDASRHADGSGLGLAIAGSLTALQGGALTIVPDGDLFRADIRLNR